MFRLIGHVHTGKLIKHTVDLLDISKKSMVSSTCDVYLACRSKRVGILRTVHHYYCYKNQCQALLTSRNRRLLPFSMNRQAK